MLISRPAPRRLLVAAATLGLVAASLTVAAVPASAATTNVTVTGTSDVYDSGLVQAVLAPGFQKAYSQYKLNYISEGTGKAIQDAENGVADALIVHAPSLENAFVAGTPINGGTAPGVSYSKEAAGRAIFYGDYILAGATTDPAAVDPTDANDIVSAFEQVATAGAAGNAVFVSRGGTPGTTVQEHAIWALTTGVPTCNVSAANGGGATPSTTNIGTDCPSTVVPPSWYKVTGLTQGPNIVNANTCNYGSTTNDCYVFTDRGTFNYLQSGSSSQAGNLKLLVRNNSASARGGATLLVNTFHAYVVNPAAVTGGSNLNTAGATAFLDYLTSPAAQTAIGQYLSGDNDPPFIPDAAPSVTPGARPTAVNGGNPVTFTGTVTNQAKGTPALSKVQVNVLAQPTATPNADFKQVATGVTGSDGSFSIPYTPIINENYQITTPALPMNFEYTETTGPDFYDALQATSTSLGSINVKGVVSDVTATASKGAVDFKATTLPIHYGSTAYLSLRARPAGSTGAYTYEGRKLLKPGTSAVHQSFALKAGKYQYFLRYSNAGYIATGDSAAKTITVK